MAKSGTRANLIVLSAVIVLTVTSWAQSPRPLRASQVMALEAGGALQSNIAHDIAYRGLAFHPDDEFVSLMKKAGADASVLSALKAARLDGNPEVRPDPQLLRQLSDAAVLMKAQKYADAGMKLSDALDVSFARMETGFVMAELLRRQEKYDVAQSVYAEILEKEPDFPEVHTKASIVLYLLGDTESALSEANAALQQNPNDAEAHKDKALVFESMGKSEAAIGEYQEALRIKADYALVRYDLGVLYGQRQQHEEAIAEYKKAIGLDPTLDEAHYNLGLEYQKKGNLSEAVKEYREAKRMNPDRPEYRQNLASALMSQSPGEAIKELKELEQNFPTFTMCHLCLARALAWQGDAKGAEQEYRKIGEVDPSDPSGHLGLGGMQEQQKKYDAALNEYRQAAKIAPEDAEAHEAIGRILLSKNDVSGALQELKTAESLGQASPRIHALYGKALLASGQTDLALGELKEAVALDSKNALTMAELAAALEKKGDWIGALEHYRKAVLTDREAVSKTMPGQSVEICGSECANRYKSAQGRFADYLVSLKTAGRSSEATELEKKASQLDTQTGTKEKVQLALQSGDQAFQQRNIEEAEKQYKQAVQLAENLPPGDDNHIAALGRLGNAYAMRQNYTEAAAMFHQQLAVVEKTFGAGTQRSVEPLRFLGQLAAFQKNYKEAESYFQRALDIDEKMAGDNSGPAVESLRGMAGLYMAQSDWPKAETYLLRAVKGAEASQGMVMIPLWGLCDLYDHWDKPDKGQPCWHHATELMAQQYGENSPNLAQSLTSEANASRKLGHNEEAQKIEERLGKLRRTAE
jgi:tetratricopeptide (TPR) repeat protein